MRDNIFCFGSKVRFLAEIEHFGGEKMPKNLNFNGTFYDHHFRITIYEVKIYLDVANYFFHNSKLRIE